MTSSRKITKAQGKHAKKLSADKSTKKREFKASKALKSFFHDAGGKLQRVILENGYLIISYSLQSYLILYISPPPSLVYKSNKGILTDVEV